MNQASLNIRLIKIFPSIPSMKKESLYSIFFSSATSIAFLETSKAYG